MNLYSPKHKHFEIPFLGYKPTGIFFLFKKKKKILIYVYASHYSNIILTKKIIRAISPEIQILLFSDDVIQSF